MPMSQQVRPRDHSFLTFFPGHRYAPDVFDPFCGQNSTIEIETYEEFITKTAQTGPSPRPFLSHQSSCQ